MSEKEYKKINRSSLIYIIIIFILLLIIGGQFYYYNFVRVNDNKKSENEINNVVENDNQELKENEKNNQENVTKVEETKENGLEIGRMYSYSDVNYSDGLLLGNDWSIQIMNEEEAYINFVTYSSGDGLSTCAPYKVTGNKLEVKTEEFTYVFTILDDGTLKYDFTGDILK